MKLHLSILLSILCLNLYAGGVPGPHPSVKKRILLSSKDFSYSPDLLINSIGVSHSDIKLKPLNKQVEEDIQIHRDELIRVYDERFSNHPNTPKYSFFGVDNIIFPLVSVGLSKESFDKISKNALKHLFSLRKSIRFYFTKKDFFVDVKNSLTII